MTLKGHIKVMLLLISNNFEMKHARHIITIRHVLKSYKSFLKVTLDLILVTFRGQNKVTLFLMGHNFETKHARRITIRHV